jgi:uncharacterized BrkB/YihY/UPF0761 family membrane protein
VIGALFFLTLATWVDTLKEYVDETMKPLEKRDYVETKGKAFASVIITLVVIFLAILIYMFIEYKKDE